jgi:NAD(P)-dependent dehydrogenase (short-subunit alcohol dehydrogenase family)
MKRASLEGQHVVIIGGSSGMGLATAELALMAGARVTIAGRSGERLERAASVLGGKARTAMVDATSRPAVEGLFATIEPVDHLVLSVATGGGGGSFRELDLDSLRRAVEGKLFAFLECLQAALARLRADGSVIFVTAASARMAAPGTAGIAANNGALNAAVGPLAVELAPLRINAVCPGIVDTPIFEAWDPALKAKFFERADASPAGRPGRPEEVAEAILMLMTNGFITGTLIDIDGGMHLLH